LTYSPKNHIRIITAASLFDGHDASINIIRRVLQDAGCEVIHLGHNKSVLDIVRAAVQESAQGICISSYQGGHMEFFKYTRDLLDQAGASYVKIYGGGGGVIVHDEKKELEAYGIAQIFHPDDGRKLGLEGMIQMIVQGCDFDVLEVANKEKQPSPSKDPLIAQLSYEKELGLQITAVDENKSIDKKLAPLKKNAPVILGITGTGGAGKSSLVDEIVQRFVYSFKDIRIGIFCVDPTKRKTGGALLGDRIRMNAIESERTFMRSVASRGSGKEISTSLPDILNFTKKSGQFDLIIAETSGIGQGGGAITELSDVSLYVMTSEFGAQSQLEKIEMIDYADLISINKADRKGSLDALRDVRKQYRRSRKQFHDGADEDLPVFLTQASQFNDEGVNKLFFAISDKVSEKGLSQYKLSPEKRKELRATQKQTLIPSERKNYLSQITQSIRQYKKDALDKSKVATELFAIKKTIEAAPELKESLEKVYTAKSKKLSAEDLSQLENWADFQKKYSGDEYSYQVRDKVIKQPLTKISLSGLKIKRVAVPQFQDWGERFKFLKLENVPGEFPYTAGVFPIKREGEDPKRQFAGEGTPERTNRRFHYLSKDDGAKRLSVAFDSVTLYGEDPHLRPDIYGKVGESGVSICTLNDMKKLLDGFDLCDPQTSVSMTINGPAPIILAFYMNAAIDQQVLKKEKELKRILTPEEFLDVRKYVVSTVRGTVQADILKEDQAQNTCIFSTDFALKMMGDMQEYFIQNQIRNFYSVSISGYHIAEAGANPISQLAFTLSNGFTYVEYYLSRGMKIDDFAQNLSFFFSNGLDPEYSVLGRVARRIWAISMKNLYNANERSQKLKYHIQTSGRSLHAQEIDFNDIRTTLQALIAIYDNCNSLHTNAYDEAITTPTEESVRRAMAIQMIINKEFGPAMNENTMQGSYFFEDLTDLVEEAVLEEFLRINERGGVLGAMETQYQRSKIQDESYHYEMLKHDGTLPIIGVNTYINPKTLEEGYVPAKIEMARATPQEKKQQLDNLENYQKTHLAQATKHLETLRFAALKGENTFEALMEAARHCSLGQMTHALYEVGGKYRRSI
jgi:methylmalonyl-CoA mutase